MYESPLQWFVVYTRPRWEKKVAGLLSRKGIEYYCPLNKVQKQWSDRKKIVEVPLFTSYVFVHIPKESYSHVRQTSGIVNFVYWLGKPAIIKDEEIDTIKRFLNEYQSIQLEKAKVNVNDHVRILNGLFLSKEGKVIEKMHETVKVLLPSLGFALVAQVDITNIQKVDRSENASTLSLHSTTSPF